jgi:F1F0 ATPase subunit 2
MSDALTLLLAWAAGAGLGAVFYGGLWWTVRNGVVSERPAVWFLGSTLLRTALTVAGFYLVAGGRWERLLACLLGFVMAQVVVMWRTRAPGGRGGRREQEAGDATHS